MEMPQGYNSLVGERGADFSVANVNAWPWLRLCCKTRGC